MSYQKVRPLNCDFNCEAEADTHPIIGFSIAPQCGADQSHGFGPWLIPDGRMLYADEGRRGAAGPGRSGTAFFYRALGILI